MHLKAFCGLYLYTHLVKQTFDYQCEAFYCYLPLLKSLQIPLNVYHMLSSVRIFRVTCAKCIMRNADLELWLTNGFDSD